MSFFFYMAFVLKGTPEQYLDFVKIRQKNKTVQK